MGSGERWCCACWKFRSEPRRKCNTHQTRGEIGKCTYENRRSPPTGAISRIAHQPHGASMSQNSALRRSIVLKHRPDGAPRREHFEIREDAVPQPRRRRGGDAHHLAVDRPLHARPAARAADLCAAGEPRRRDDRRDRGRGDRLGTRRLCARRRGGRCARLADALRDAGRPAGEARPAGCAAVDLSRHTRHAGSDRLPRRQRNPASRRRARRW